MQRLTTYSSSSSCISGVCGKVSEGVTCCLAEMAEEGDVNRYENVPSSGVWHPTLEYFTSSPLAIPEVDIPLGRHGSRDAAAITGMATATDTQPPPVEGELSSEQQQKRTDRRLSLHLKFDNWDLHLAHHL